MLNYRVQGYGLPGDPVDSTQGQLRLLQMCTKILINWVLQTGPRDVKGSDLGVDFEPIVRGLGGVLGKAFIGVLKTMFQGLYRK